ncbi:alkaline phosphatase D family protein [Sphingomonas naphthae]|uniref:Alkaline phosphatase D family protein n=1 Tax=Sphingomonas naphthae TaxID=1813468 RepID=A0ABY7TM53_9SPHN|nr:alkaline phosphatase D family protein [Sphingomonas naphthae]WCT73841.1 alkaline phosphatase D family protein [Sphingomonas naphthae]
MTIITRRGLIGGAIAGGGLLAAPAILRAQQIFAAYPFRLGIAAGDPAPDGFVIWTRLAPDPLAPHGGMPMRPVAVDWAVATDERMKTVVQKGSAFARPELAHSVHVEVTGLEPGRPYFYRFTIGTEKSMVGRAMTVPPLGATLDKLRFAVCGCQDYEAGLYTAYAHMADEEVDFVYHYGDYIYENRQDPVAFDHNDRLKPKIRQHIGQMCYSLDDYRQRYAQYKLDPDLQLAHTRAAWFTTIDDHEVRDNWAGLSDATDTPPEIFALRRAAAFQAFYEHMPVRASALPAAGGIQIYRRQRYGDLLDAHFLDTRQFRSKQVCKDGFKPICPEIDRPDLEVMGRTEEAWLAGNLRQKAARWNLIAQQVMMMPLDRRTSPGGTAMRNFDSWGGYNAPRERVLKSWKGYGNIVVLTGDEHQNFAGDLRTENGTGEAVATEFVLTSISSGGTGSDVREGDAVIRANNPFLKWTNDRRGYGVVEVTPETWTTTFRVVDQVDGPGGVVSTAQVATVEHGKQGVALARA